MKPDEERHETTDMDPKYILYFAIALTVVGVLIQIGVWWMFRQFNREQAGRENQLPIVTATKPPPQPRLQIDPQGDLEELRRQENEILTTYRWVDRQKGIARIPVDRAMQVFLERQKK
jgi:hypothetical protein